MVSLNNTQKEESSMSNLEITLLLKKKPNIFLLSSTYPYTTISPCWPLSKWYSVLIKWQPREALWVCVFVSLNHQTLTSNAKLS